MKEEEPEGEAGSEVKSSCLEWGLSIPNHGKK
jgi:hypothetical protein